MNAKAKWLVAVLLSMSLASGACRGKRGSGPPQPGGGGPAPSAGGDVLALLSPPGPLTEDLVQRLAALRIDHLWLFAGEVGGPGVRGAEVTLRYRIPLGVFVIVRPDFFSRLTEAGGAAAAAEVAAQLTGAARRITDRGNSVDTGAVVFAEGEIAPAGMKAFVSALRKETSASFPTLAVVPPIRFHAQKGANEALADATAVVPLVLGTPPPGPGEIPGKLPPPVDARTAEGLGRPYLAGFWLAAGGMLLDAGGAVQQTFPESTLDRFSELPEADISLGGTFDEEVGYTYRITPRRAGQVGGTPVAAGSEVRFRGVTPIELVTALGDLSRGQFPHFAGRVYFAADFPQSDGTLGVEALEDAVAGKPIAPDPAVYVDPADARSVTVTLRNRSRFGSSLSQMNNFIEIYVPSGSLASVEPGRFDRWDLFLGTGDSAQRTTPRKADRVRLHEYLVGPFEKVGSATLRFVGKVPPIRTSVSVLGADGREIVTAPSAAEPTPPEPDEGAGPETSAPPP